MNEKRRKKLHVTWFDRFNRSLQKLYSKSISCPREQKHGRGPPSFCISFSKNNLNIEFFPIDNQIYNLLSLCIYSKIHLSSCSFFVVQYILPAFLFSLLPVFIRSSIHFLFSLFIFALSSFFFFFFTNRLVHIHPYI